jgi:hypothetical protein
VTCGPLEGVPVCFCRSLTCESLIVKAEGHLDLHLGNEAHMLDDAPALSLDTLERERFLGGHLETMRRACFSSLHTNVGL